MKKIFIILAIIFTGTGFLYAQDETTDARKAEKIQALKVAFISQKLELSSEEAQRFWPVYTRYENEMKQVLTDNQQNGDVLAKDERVLNIRKKYRMEFGNVLGQQRVNTLFKTENEFRSILIRHLRNQGGGGRKQNFNRPQRRPMLNNRP